MIALLAALPLYAAPAFPHPALVVLNKEENKLSVVDVKTMAIVGARVPTGIHPHEVTVSADGTRAFVANYGSAQAPGTTISIVDLVARKVLRTVDLLPLVRPHGIIEGGGKV